MFSKFFKRLVLVFIVLFCVSFSHSFAYLFDDEIRKDIPYDQNCIDGDCLVDWINAASWIKALETKKKASQYIQDVIVYLLGFLTLIATIYIIYAWFNLLIWAWNDDSVKNSKNTIIYVIIWIVLIWLAFPITKFIFQVLSSSPSP